MQAGAEGGEADQHSGFDPAVRDALVIQAKARGQSLQAYLLELVETQACRLRNTDVLDRFGRRSDGTRSLPGETRDREGGGGDSPNPAQVRWRKRQVSS